VEDAAIVGELVGLARSGGARVPRLESYAGAHQYLRLYRLVRRYVPPGARVLDWGAGSGHFSFFLSRAGYRACGYSFKEFAFASWLADPSYEFTSGSPAEPRKIPYADASFDAVSSIGVLEHVRETGGDEASSLAEIARVLRPGGVFVCYHFPNRWSWIEYLAEKLGREHRHVYRFTRGDIERLVRGAGLELLEVERYGFLPRNSLSRLPDSFARSRSFARLWDALDAALGTVFSPLCQNWCFAARKPG